jgi:hypothetical protein
MPKDPQGQKTSKPKHADPSEFERFVETAIEVGADKDGKALDVALKKIASQKKTRASS